uniref:Secreted metalloprotease n=1 Tax=Heterorhabditis bacteriophora TaxID=37862 RepID=A0A1I7X462_HETBA
MILFWFIPLVLLGQIRSDGFVEEVEPNYRTAETTIAFEDNMDTSLSKVTRINHVFCLYTRSVQTIRYSDVATRVFRKQFKLFLKESFDVYSAYSSSISALGTVTSGPIGYGGHSRQAMELIIMLDSGAVDVLAGH